MFTEFYDWFFITDNITITSHQSEGFVLKHACLQIKDVTDKESTFVTQKTMKWYIDKENKQTREYFSSVLKYSVNSFGIKMLNVQGLCR